ncbi:MAG: tRNA glutamyl-Q(34) synthetase GluQRS [Alphaproteobacteria bacterium]|nr:tRNA glutamyl-Q(34) synthetase GluQRS [Alphaproteobacteria bacterium]MCB9792281.1 tRNA glutamyl-Q(34) synthetase GluQRS [Alphaproteobacteria bacterium]
MPHTTRFAPSPSGQLHLGHAYAARFARDAAEGGRFLVRIEDIDVSRCRPEHEAGIFEDLAWLGLDWERPVRRQSQHLGDYAEALGRLQGMGLVYPCFCTRRDIREEIERAGGAPHGPEGPLYPGTCRRLDPVERAERLAAGEGHALRLDVAEAARVAGPLRWQDLDAGEQAAEPESLGDAVLGRKDIGTSYHLAVTLDDALQGVTLVTRGQDLFHATHLHRLLQALLDLPVPLWRHHGLVRDAEGKRLATRDKALALAAIRAEGVSPAALWARLGF